MEVGGYRVDPVVDGEGRLWPDEALPGVRAASWERHRALLVDGRLLPIVVGGFLLRGRGRTILVDLGYGPGALGGTPTGRMPGSLRERGVDPADVTDVLFTHLHRDHVGWASSGGIAVFPHARLCCGAGDRTYFLEQRPDPAVVELLGPCADRLGTFEDGIDLTGIAAVPAPGHTPGSTIITVSDGQNQLMLLGDVAHFPVQLIETRWTTPWDVDPELACRTREQVVRPAVDDPSVWLVGAHFPAMRPGRLLDQGGELRWEPL
ncbi:MBL fold metallo-hydrolase [Pseudonocardia cypriaca]|uniref:Glyoxylase-like metal-dependent hydrolase (Beta-lactamase superfamily II) n=1 Tax=Pseudonocardia cypriaca TaxID=882449 RepID=A0A543FXA1_9PSEU|nr:MBL fold metallo-hydrolase [Pseudonocardia cypriaca]TQM38463.1 glyoxylase-like metal-dependent hydrolase (beta-lactamase superfamily II) [Pseudonocardia cypriaca]